MIQLLVEFGNVLTRQYKY